MMKWFGPYTGYALQQELENVPVPVGVPCARCEEPFVATDTGIYIPGIPPEDSTYPYHNYPFHWNCHLRQAFGCVEHIKRGHDDCDGTCQDDPNLTTRQAADAAVAAYFRKHGREQPTGGKDDV